MEREREREREQVGGKDNLHGKELTWIKLRITIGSDVEFSMRIKLGLGNVTRVRVMCKGIYHDKK